MDTYASKIKKYENSKGSKFFVYPFGQSDTVSVVFSVAGGHYITKNPLIADLHASMLMEGTRKRTKKDIQIFLDSVGAVLSFAPSFDRLEATIKVRSVHLQSVLALAVEMLTEPTFPVKEFAVLKKHFAGALQVEAEDTRTQASQELSALMYEKTHPNYSNTTAEKKKLLVVASRTDILAYHKKIGGAESLVVSVAGGVNSISPTELSAYFNKIVVQKNVSKVVLPTPKISTSGTSVAVVPGKASVDHMIGIRFGVTSEHKDYPALMLAVRILGNPGFTGRLMKTVREKEGLTYASYSFMRGFDSGADGAMVVWSSFAPSLFTQGRAAVLRELALLVEKGPTQAEFDEHVFIFISNWHVRFSKSSAFASAIHDAVIENKGLEYLDSFPNKVGKTTRGDVLRVLKNYFSLESLSEAAAGTVEKDALSS